MRQSDRGDGKPRCYDTTIQPFILVNNGYTHDGRLEQVPIPHAMTRDCAAWKADPSSLPVPLMEKWACDGCIRYPTQDVELSVRRMARLLETGK